MLAGIGEVLAVADTQIPSYLGYKGRKKEEFLNSLGISDYNAINLFTLLGVYARKTGKADFSAKEFLAVVQLWAKDNEKPGLQGVRAGENLVRILDTLERQYLASIERKSGRPVTFVLKEEGTIPKLESEQADAIRKAYKDLEEDPKKPYPQKSAFDIPDEMLVELNYREFTQRNLDKNAQADKVIKITFLTAG